MIKASFSTTEWKNETPGVWAGSGRRQYRKCSGISTTTDKDFYHVVVSFSSGGSWASLSGLKCTLCSVLNCLYDIFTFIHSFTMWIQRHLWSHSQLNQHFSFAQECAFEVNLLFINMYHTLVSHHRAAAREFLSETDMKDVLQEHTSSTLEISHITYKRTVSMLLPNNNLEGRCRVEISPTCDWHIALKRMKWPSESRC